MSNSGTNVQPDALKAAVIYEPEVRGGRQRLVVELSYIINQGQPIDFGWVMPLPGKPGVSTAPADFFNKLDYATVHKKTYLKELSEVVIDRKCGEIITSVVKGRGEGTSTSGAPGSGVTVVSQQNVDEFVVSVVQATDRTALQNWTVSNGYNTTSLSDKAIESYIKDKWYFVLAKLPMKGIASTVRYNAQLMLLDFETPTPIYPWSLAAYNKNGEIATNRQLPVRVYTLQPNKRLEVANYAGSALSFNYSEKLSPEQSSTLLKGLPGDNNKSFFLAKYGGDSSFVNALELAQGDLQFRATTDESELNSGKMSPSETAQAIGLTLVYPILLLVLLWPLLLVLAAITLVLLILPGGFRFEIWLIAFTLLVLPATYFGSCYQLPTLALTGLTPYLVILAISLVALIRKKLLKRLKN